MLALSLFHCDFFPYWKPLETSAIPKCGVHIEFLQLKCKTNIVFALKFHHLLQCRTFAIINKGYSWLDTYKLLMCFNHKHIQLKGWIFQEYCCVTDHRYCSCVAWCSHSGQLSRILDQSKIFLPAVQKLHSSIYSLRLFSDRDVWFFLSAFLEDTEIGTKTKIWRDSFCLQ